MSGEAKASESKDIDEKSITSTSKITVSKTCDLLCLQTVKNDLTGRPNYVLPNYVLSHVESTDLLLSV